MKASRLVLLIKFYKRGGREEGQKSLKNVRFLKPREGKRRRHTLFITTVKDLKGGIPVAL